MISTQQISYILAVSETGSISKAAQLCYVTQPTLSMQLKKAEELLGNVIFQRDSPQLELTDFGLALIPLLRQLQSDFSAVDHLVDQRKGIFKEHLRIGVIPTIAAYLLPDNFKKWQELLPQTTVVVEEMKSEELIEALDQRKLDLAIMAGPFAAMNKRVIPLYTEEISAYVPSRITDNLTNADLRDLQPWLLSKGNCLRTQMMHFCGVEEKTLNSWNYEGGNMELLMRMVDQQGGYTLIPEFYIPYASNSTGFKSIRGENNLLPARTVVAISRYKQSNWASLEKLIRSIQFSYNRPINNELEILSW